MSALDGCNILRYGHIFDGGGGMEQYVMDLNLALAERAAFHLMQVQLTSCPANTGESEEPLGLGRFQRVSLFVEQSSHEQAIAGPRHGDADILRGVSAWRDRILFRPWIYSGLTRHALKLRRAPRRPGEPDNPSRAVARLHDRFSLDLICLHSAGGADAEEILDFAKARGIPTVYIHHFSNDRLSTLAMCRQMERVDGVAGVCGVDVPAFLKLRFHNVSDGIDTRFFSRWYTGPARSSDPPVLFLPSRITPTKGQADLVRAAAILRRRGLNCRVVFAGRTDSTPFMSELRELILREELTDSVEFTGALGPAGLRQWYGRAAIVAFPTRHHEGLGRILVEGQSMEVPAVAYRIGGTSEAVRDGETGFLVRIGDIDAFVERVAELLTNEKRRVEMGRTGREFVLRQFTREALAERHEQFYSPFLPSRRYRHRTCTAMRASR